MKRKANAKGEKRISSPDDLVRTSKKGEVELKEEELAKATGGLGVVPVKTISWSYDDESPKEVGSRPRGVS